MKPSDFLLGVLDFFAVLLPGALGMWLASHYVPPRFASMMLPGHGAENVEWVVFFLGSFMLGHFIFMAGSRVDSVYDEWRVRTKPTDADHNFQAAKALQGAITNEINGDRLTTLKWAKSYIQIHAPEARGEIDQLEANSKFFRSVVVLSVAFTAHFALREGSIDLACLSVVLGVLSFQRFRDQRWKMTEMSYFTAVILYETKVKCEKAQEPKVVKASI